MPRTIQRYSRRVDWGEWGSRMQRFFRRLIAHRSSASENSRLGALVPAAKFSIAGSARRSQFWWSIKSRLSKMTIDRESGTPHQQHSQEHAGEDVERQTWEFRSTWRRPGRSG